jgi:membrane protein YqaA with SNARE-associated domain
MGSIARLSGPGVDSNVPPRYSGNPMHDFLIEYGLLSLFLVSFGAATLLPFGSEWLLIALLLKGFDPQVTVVVATVGNTLGASSNWLIGLFGSGWLMTRVLRVDAAGRQRAERLFQRFGLWSLLFSWLPVIGDPLCLVAGLLKVPFGRFLLLVAVGKFLRYAVLALLLGAGQVAGGV